MRRIMVSQQKTVLRNKSLVCVPTLGQQRVGENVFFNFRQKTQCSTRVEAPETDDVPILFSLADAEFGCCF